MQQKQGLAIKRTRHSLCKQPEGKIAYSKKMKRMKTIIQSIQHLDKKFNLNFKLGSHHKKEVLQLTLIQNQI